jgi:Polyketide synthase dehydratase
VMPLTGSLELLCQAAAFLVPDRKVTGAQNMQVFRPLNATENQPPTRLQISAKQTAPGEVRVTIRSAGNILSQATVLLSPAYPSPPVPIEIALANPRVPMCTGKDVYATHRMFHGPSFQGICAIDQVGDNGLLAQLEILPTDNLLASDRKPRFEIDPYLLDAAGQLVGYWPLEYLQEGFVVLPVKIAEIARYHENPPPGTRLGCRLRLRHVNQRTLAADYDVLMPNGQVWLRVSGWEDWRFYWPPSIYNSWRWPKTEYPSVAVKIPALEASGYECRWIDARGDQEREGLAGEVWMRILLNRNEIAEFERVPADQRSDWLLVRTTAKDAVRSWTVRHHGRSLYPADIEIEQECAGGFWSSELPAPRVSTYLHDSIAVAAAGPNENAVAVLDTSFQPLPPDEEDWLSRTPDPNDWRGRVLAAKLAAGRYLLPSADQEYYRQLLIAKIDTKQGIIEIADPGSAVNAEDTVTVATARQDDLWIAVAFK